MSLTLVALGVLWAQPADPGHSEHEHEQMAGHDHSHMHGAPGAPLTAAETDRLASGTAWQPAEVPHAGWHLPLGEWMLMVHELLFAGYDWQGRRRGGDAVTAVGWLMGMARRDFSSGSFLFRTMLSPEPWTVRDGGYPLLLQTGETYQGQPLRDRQHPHDLFMEVAILHTQRFTEGLAAQLYLAPAGEPALGPPGFPHRVSAGADPLAPIAHHWLDSTHISFGVVTAGLVGRHFKLEGSWFNGREPDETRTDFDLERPDSWAVRLQVAGDEHWVGQLSYGHMPNPEALHRDPHDRATASVTHHLAFPGGGEVATTVAIGANRSDDHGTAPAFLGETTLDLDGADVVFVRLEYVRKHADQLVIPAPAPAQTFDIGNLVVGYLRNFGPFAGLVPGVGVRANFGLLPSSLAPEYGTRAPYGGMVYVRLANAATSHGE
jgi:hypothetical protein